MAADKRLIFDKLALGCISYLESFPECRAVTFQGNDPAQNIDYTSWERKHGPFKLPQDLKAFYSIFNGFILSWNVEIGDKIETIGDMRLNKIDNIVKSNVEYFVQDKLPDDVIPPSPKSSTLFVIDNSCPLGEIVLLYRSSSSTVGGDDPEVWLLDQTAQLTYLCRSVTHYLRLLVVHLGIKGWQGAFMDRGWSPSTQLWMNMFCKERLVVDRHYRNDSYSSKRN